MFCVAFVYVIFKTAERQSDGVLATLKGLPPLPQVLLRLQEEFSKAEPSLQSISEVVADDPALAARFLRLANSSLYMPGTEILSVHRAVLQLGLDETRRVSMALLLINQAMGPGRTTSPVLWRHALAVGFFAEYFAEDYAALSESLRPAAFTAGLLHDIGDTALKLITPLEQEPEHGNFPEEIAAWGIVHTDAGLLLADLWCLPTAICDVIADHHNAHTDNPLVRVVRAADQAAALLGFGHSPVHAPQDIEERQQVLAQIIEDMSPNTTNQAEATLAENDAEALLLTLKTMGARSVAFIDLASDVV